MRAYVEGNDIILKVKDDFILKHIFECGQCFRWNPIDEVTYEGIAMGHYLQLKEEVNQIRFLDTTLKQFNDLWLLYFDLNTDYSDLKERVSALHPVLGEAVDFGSGIRILKQDPWETLISFIISANNNIPRIKMLIRKLAEAFGDQFINNKGEVCYTFPSPVQLTFATEEKLREMGMGYRAKYIYEVAQKVSHEYDSYNHLTNLNTVELEKALLKYMGVGPKVASCVMLFGYGKMDTFPVDTWIRKVLIEWFAIESTRPTEVREAIKCRFSGLEGIAQQYLFYYAREHKLEIGQGIK